MQNTAIKIAKYVPWLYIMANCFFALLGVTLLVGLLSLMIENIKNLFMIISIATLGLFVIMIMMSVIFYFLLWFYCKKTYRYLITTGKEISATIKSSKAILMSPYNFPTPNVFDFEVEYENKKLHFIDYVWTISDWKHRYVPRSGEKTFILTDQDLQMGSLKRPLNKYEV